MPREKQFDETEAIRRFTEVFWRKGYNGCSVGDLVAASGLSRSSLYDTFGDKEQLFTRCLTAYSDELHLALITATEHEETPAGKIAAALSLPFRMQPGRSCKGCLTVNTMAELDGASPEIQQLVVKAKGGWEGFLSDCIRQGQERGQFRTEEPADVLAGLIYTTFCGMLTVQKASASPEILQRQIRALLQLLAS